MAIGSESQFRGSVPLLIGDRVGSAKQVEKQFCKAQTRPLAEHSMLGSKAKQGQG